jgi:UDP-N-acetylglucosamine 2-epimerase (non-hydrolysing)
VDSTETMMRIADALKEIAVELPLIFPVHPRTRNFSLIAGNV